MRLFDHMPPGAVCPACGRDDDAPCVLDAGTAAISARLAEVEG